MPQDTAYHEAGHVVAKLWFQIEFDHVTIEPDEESGSLGHVQGIPLSGFNPEPDILDDDPSSGLADILQRQVQFYEGAITESGRLSREEPGCVQENLDATIKHFEWNRQARDSESERTSRQDLERSLISSFAGEAATYVLTGEEDEVGAGRADPTDLSGDARWVLEVIVKLLACGSDKDAPASQAAHHYWQFLWWRTVQLFSDPFVWQKVKAIAEELKNEKTLSYDECRAIYDKRDSRETLTPE